MDGISSNEDEGDPSHDPFTFLYKIPKRKLVSFLDSIHIVILAGVIARVHWTVAEKAKTGKPSVGNMSLGGGFSAVHQAVDAVTMVMAMVMTLVMKIVTLALVSARATLRFCCCPWIFGAWIGSPTASRAHVWNCSSFVDTNHWL